MLGSTDVMVAVRTRLLFPRGLDTGGFRVVPASRAGEQIFMVVAPTGVALYSFADLHNAAAEAAALNAVSS
jgi:hypothetical protein